MNVLFAPDAWDDYLYWQANDKKIATKINKLIEEIRRTPYEGTGKPEALRFRWSGWWSRRIDLEHRLVYRINGDVAEIVQCRHHY